MFKFMGNRDLHIILIQKFESLKAFKKHHSSSQSKSQSLHNSCTKLHLTRSSDFIESGAYIIAQFTINSKIIGEPFSIRPVIHDIIKSNSI